jgi:hypothetical protein
MKLTSPVSQKLLKEPNHFFYTKYIKNYIGFPRNMIFYQILVHKTFTNYYRCLKYVNGGVNDFRFKLKQLKPRKRQLIF